MQVCTLAHSLGMVDYLNQSELCIEDCRPAAAAASAAAGTGAAVAVAVVDSVVVVGEPNEVDLVRIERTDRVSGRWRIEAGTAYDKAAMAARRRGCRRVPAEVDTAEAAPVGTMRPGASTVVGMEEGKPDTEC